MDNYQLKDELIVPASKGGAAILEMVIESKLLMLKVSKLET